MGMLDLLLGRREVPAKARNSRGTGGTSSANSTQFAASQLSPNSALSSSVRKDLLKLVLRETLNRNGIPQGWLSADMLRTTTAQREQGLHVRFLVRVWEPRLLAHGPALEQEFAQRLSLLDPQSTEWLMGFSWQFSLPDTSVCPSMPHPGSWTAPPEAAQPAPAKPADPPVGQAGDVIEGPVVIPQPAEDVRADLERLLAARDEDMKRHGGDSFAPTRPATL
jgi:hypothetical protein